MVNYKRDGEILEEAIRVIMGEEPKNEIVAHLEAVDNVPKDIEGGRGEQGDSEA